MAWARWPQWSSLCSMRRSASTIRYFFPEYYTFKVKVPDGLPCLPQSTAVNVKSLVMPNRYAFLSYFLFCSVLIIRFPRDAPCLMPINEIPRTSVLHSSKDPVEQKILKPHLKPHLKPQHSAFSDCSKVFPDTTLWFCEGMILSLFYFCRCQILWQHYVRRMCSQVWGRLVPKQNMALYGVFTKG